jgi:hypothetical protein
VRVELPQVLSGDGDLGDPELEWPSLPARVSFQVGYEFRLDEASTASPAMDPPRIRGSKYQFDVLLLAVPGPLSGPPGCGGCLGCIVCYVTSS